MMATFIVHDAEPHRTGGAAVSCQLHSQKTPGRGIPNSSSSTQALSDMDKGVASIPLTKPRHTNSASPFSTSPTHVDSIGTGSPVTTQLPLPAHTTGAPLLVPVVSRSRVGLDAGFSGGAVAVSLTETWQRSMVSSADLFAHDLAGSPSLPVRPKSRSRHPVALSASTAQTQAADPVQRTADLSGPVWAAHTALEPQVRDLPPSGNDPDTAGATKWARAQWSVDSGRQMPAIAAAAETQAGY